MNENERKRPYQPLPKVPAWAAKGYDGTGRHELRDQTGALWARGCLTYIQRRRQLIEEGKFPGAMPQSTEGWTVLPYEIEDEDAE